MKAPGPSEQELHAAVADLLDAVLPEFVVWTTFPAGWGKLGRATAGRLKRSGLKEGMPDIMVFWLGNMLGIELKVGRNKPTLEQCRMFHRLENAGFEIAVCRSVEDVVFVLENLEVPTRGYSLDGYQHGTKTRTTTHGQGTSVTQSDASS